MQGEHCRQRALFNYAEVVAVANLGIIEEGHHLLLGIGGEEEAKFAFVRTIFGVEEGFKLSIGHHRKAVFIIQISGEFLQLLFRASFGPPIKEGVLFARVLGGIARVGEVGRGVVCEEEEGGVVVFGIGAHNGGRQNFRHRPRTAAAITIGVTLLDEDGAAPGATLFTHGKGASLHQCEGVPAECARLQSVHRKVIICIRSPRLGGKEGFKLAIEEGLVKGGLG